MRNFIGKMGYTLMWGFGIPEYSLEERFEDYYKVGLIIAILGIIAMVVLIVLFILYLKKGNEVEGND
ncbi:MAG: hypothetical protein IKF82_00945 [Bacilli bacterium]|nr:hypothetical protein [Bacilli bacterium]